VRCDNTRNADEDALKSDLFPPRDRGCNISAMGPAPPTSDGPRIVPADGGREITVMGARVRYLLPADAPAPGRFSVIEWTVPAFYAAPPTLHHHLEDDWAAMVLEGSVAPATGSSTATRPTYSACSARTSTPVAHRGPRPPAFTPAPNNSARARKAAAPKPAAPRRARRAPEPPPSAA
jgi:hypothetical protein